MDKENSLKEKRRKKSLGNLKPIQKGEVRNPKGRTKGTRNKFSEAFMQDILTDWQKGGSEAIERVRITDPSTYLRVAASIIPKDFNINNVSEAAFDSFMDDLEDDELDKLITGLVAAGSHSKSKKGTTKKGATKQPSTVH